MMIGEQMLWELKRRVKEDRRPAPLMWTLLREEEKVKARHVTIVDCQDISPGNVVNPREEEREENEAKEVMEDKGDIRAKEKGKVKEKERVIRDLAGIVVKRVTSQQNAGM